jgi:FkbM family methyltransferase
MASRLRKTFYYLSSIPNLLLGIEEPLRVLRIFLGSSLPAPVELTIRASAERGPLRFRVRSKMDVWSLKETFLDRFYERCAEPIHPGWTVVDIGAGIGDFTLFAAVAQPTSRIYAFEPYPESFRLLEQNIRRNRAGNATPYAEAVGGETGSLTIDLTPGEPLQLRTVETGDGVVVPSTSLADLFPRLGIERCHLLKLDCEGAEFSILYAAPPEVLSQVERIILEVHDAGERASDPGPNHRRSLGRYLEAAGFRVEQYSNPVHDTLGFLFAFRDR